MEHPNLNHKCARGRRHADVEMELVHLAEPLITGLLLFAWEPQKNLFPIRAIRVIRGLFILSFFIVLKQIVVYGSGLKTGPYHNQNGNLIQSEAEH